MDNSYGMLRIKHFISNTLNVYMPNKWSDIIHKNGKLILESFNILGKQNTKKEIELKIKKMFVFLQTPV